jgi:streptogramin lyase
VARYTYPGAKLFNDVALAANGDLYVTDSERGSVLRLPASSDKLEEFIPPDSLRYPNGIAVSTDGKHVFVAQSTGIVVADTATRKFERLKQSVDTVSAGIDGLYLDKDALIGVQNGISPHRVTRFQLNAARDAITRAEVLESRNEHFLVPTTGAVIDKVMYLLANAQLGQLDDKGGVRDRKRLHDLVILKLPLLP